MITIAFVEFAGILLIIPLCYLLARILKIVQRKMYDGEIMTLFNLYWNGKAEDELYAWYRVRRVLQNGGAEGNDKRIGKVDRKIQELNKTPLYSDMSVSAEGKIILNDLDIEVRF
jgi:hypothetical protein